MAIVFSSTQEMFLSPCQKAWHSYEHHVKTETEQARLSGKKTFWHDSHKKIVSHPRSHLLIDGAEDSVDQD